MFKRRWPATNTIGFKDVVYGDGGGSGDRRREKIEEGTTKDGLGRGMRVGFMSWGQDTGGYGHKMAEAVRNWTRHEAHSFHTTDTYLQFESEYKYPIRAEEREYVEAFLGGIDLVHAKFPLPPEECPWVFGKLNDRAVRIWMLHGERNLAQMREEKYSGRVVVSTVNLLKHVENESWRWVPALFRVQELKEARDAALKGRKGDCFRISHAPTDVSNDKGTAIFLRVIEKLRKKGVPVEAVLIRNKNNKECLEIKAGCDAVFDQLKHSMGSNGVEGCCMGQVVFVGAQGSDQDIYGHYNRIVGYVPFVRVDSEEELEKNILKCVNKNRWVERQGERAYEYAKEFHDYPQVVKRLLKIYERFL